MGQAGREPAIPPVCRGENVAIAATLANPNGPRLERWISAILHERAGQRVAGSRSPSMGNADGVREPQQEGGVGNVWGRTGDASWWQSEPDVGRNPHGFPAWLDRYVGRGLSHDESLRRSKVLRDLWCDHVSQALLRAAGGFERLSQAEILFAFVREYENGSDKARLLLAGTEASQDFLRSLRDRAVARSPSHRSRQNEQRPIEHPDPLQPMSRLLACDSKEGWAAGGWEDATPRVAYGVPARVDRLKALGNAVVPQIPELIGRAIMEATP